MSVSKLGVAAFQMWRWWGYAEGREWEGLGEDCGEVVTV